jgi:acetyl-CoA carboxylase carboxyltransferase component
VYIYTTGRNLPRQRTFWTDFRNNAQMSVWELQISAIMGSCVAGGAYLPIMSDEAIIVEGTGSIFLAGSYLVKAAIGESDNETLGGATTHCEISGCNRLQSQRRQRRFRQNKNIVDKMGILIRQVLAA